MDVREGGYSNPKGVWGELSSGSHVSRLLKALRHSLQKPQRRANQRDEEAIEHWKEERWPSLKKGH
jgi:transposase